MPVRSCLLLCLLVCAPAVAAEDFADKFWAQQNKEALRDLERGKPAQQIKAASRLGAKFAAQTAPVLIRHLGANEGPIRLAAAEVLWELAADEPGAFASAQPVLRTALDDADAAVAMNAAGALAAMGVAEAELAAARRRVLAGGARDYVGFLAARGLVGIDPAPGLLPYLLGYFLDAVEAKARDSSVDNVELAEKALARLVATGDRALIDPLLQALPSSPPATPFLLRQLHAFTPRPPGWTEILLGHVGSPYPDIRERAWSLLGDQRDAASLERWAPKAARLLADPAQRRIGLGALSGAAGRSAHGLTELAALAGDGAAEEAERVRAIELLAAAADTSDREGVASVQVAARRQWEQVCTPMLGARAVDAYFRACRDRASYIVADDAERARLIAGWLGANREIDAKIALLGSLESMWNRAAPAAAAVRAERRHADARVVQAAEAALDRIEPAWRERDARGSAAAPAASAPSARMPEAGTAKGADGVALYTAIAKGDVATVKKLVHAGNVQAPVRHAQMQGTPPTPIMIALGYCGIPQAAQGLPGIVAYLLGLGADPDVTTPTGDRLLDQAKYSCTPEIMALLAARAGG